MIMTREEKKSFIATELNAFLASPHQCLALAEKILLKIETEVLPAEEKTQEDSDVHSS